MTAYVANKWVGLAIEAGDLCFNTKMYDYLELNKWGLWLEYGPQNIFTDSGDGTNNQSAVIAYIENTLEPTLATINDSYTIPVRLDVKGLTIGGSNTVAWYQSNFDAVMARFQLWGNGTLGNCLQGYWYEGDAQPITLHQYLRQATTLKTTLGTMPRWGAPDWTGFTTAEIQACWDCYDIIDLEMWWISDLQHMLSFIPWILAYEHDKPLGIDAMANAGWPDIFHVWGYDWGGSDPEPTYREQRSRYRRYISGAKLALGRPFDSHTAEVAGDSGDLGVVGDTVDIMTEQLEFMDASKWTELTPVINDMGVQYNP